jgi:ornithine cyclodeaminase
MRTAAASAVATRALARGDAETLAIIGAGVQARTHLEAMLCVRPIRNVRVCARSHHSAAAFVETAQERHPDLTFTVADTSLKAIHGSDIVCAVSSARTPVTERSFVAGGMHVNGVGSHGPEVREVDGETMRDARVVVDSRESALRECGDCLIAIAEGLFDADHVADEIGEVLLGTKRGRSGDDEITIYQSCGLAVQDVAVGRLAYDRAIRSGLGTRVELT